MKIKAEIYSFFKISFLGMASYVMFISTFLTLFSSAPLIVLYTNKSKLYALVAAVFGVLIAILHDGGLGWTTLLYVFVVVGMAVTIGELILKHYKFEKILLISSSFFIVLYVIFCLFYWIKTGNSVASLLLAKSGEFFKLMNQHYPEMFNQIYGNVGVNNHEIIGTFALNIPSTLIIGTILFVFVNLLSVAKYRRELISSLDINRLKILALPFYLVWFSLTVGLIFVVTTFYVKASFALVLSVSTVFKTILLVYFLQGFLILYLFFRQYLGRGLLMSILLVLFVSLLYWLIIFIGFFDFWFNFRKYLKKEEENPK